MLFFLRTFFVIGAPNVVFLQGRVNVRSGKPNLSEGKPNLSEGKPNLSEPNVSKENMFCSGVFAVAGIGRDCRLGFRSVRGRTNWAAYTHTHAHGFGLLGYDCFRLVEGSTANIAGVAQWKLDPDHASEFDTERHTGGEEASYWPVDASCSDPALTGMFICSASPA